MSFLFLEKWLTNDWLQSCEYSMLISTQKSIHSTLHAEYNCYRLNNIKQAYVWIVHAHCVFNYHRTIMMMMMRMFMHTFSFAFRNLWLFFFYSLSLLSLIKIIALSSIIYWSISSLSSSSPPSTSTSLLFYYVVIATN